MSKEHTNKVALITGANRGIGFEIARQLAELGIHVLLAGRNQKAIDEAAQKLQHMGFSAEALLLDVTNKHSIIAAAEHVGSQHKKLDILINNAAIRIEKYGKQPSEQTLDEWRETFESNLFGTVEVCRCFLPLIRESVAGRIVNVSSLLASLGTHSNPDSYAYSDMFKSLPAYSASKSAVNSWTVHLAYELRNTPIKVNAVHPGYTKTALNDGEGDLDVTEGAVSSVRMALIDSAGPTGTYTHMEEVISW